MRTVFQAVALQYFVVSVGSAPKRKVMRSVRDLRLELWASMAAKLSDMGFYSGGKRQQYVPCLFMNAIQYLLYGRIWDAFEEAIDHLVFLFVLQFLRDRRDKEAEVEQLTEEFDELDFEQDDIEDEVQNFLDWIARYREPDLSEKVRAELLRLRA
jgi:hypothetical protein